MRHRARAFTMIELMVGSAVLTILLLATISIMIPLQRTSAEQAIRIDQAQQTRKVLNTIRKELRQSGWDKEGSSSVAEYEVQTGGASQSEDGNDSLWYRRRISFGDNDNNGTAGETADDTSGDGAYVSADDNWSTGVIYRVVQDGTFIGVPSAYQKRYRLERVIDANNNKQVDNNEQVIPVANGLGLPDTASGSKALQVVKLDNHTILVAITVIHRDPVRKGNTTPDPIILRVMERVQLLNRGS